MPRSQNNLFIYRLACIASVLAFLILGVRLAWIMLDPQQGKSYRDPVVSRQVIRGTVYDRSGRILAIEVPSYNVYFLLSRMEDPAHAASVVAPYIAMEPSDILQQIANYRTYALVKKDIPYEQVGPLEDALRREGLSGLVQVEKTSIRSYPAGFHASQTIGFVNAANHGLEGIEYAQDEVLHPVPALGSPDPISGDDLYLTLDIDIQYLVDLALQEIARVHQPDFASGIVLDAETGDILALSSYPWHDPNDLTTSTEESRLNHAVNYLYEPGSVFKIFSLLAVMQAGQADLDTPFVCDGSYTFDGITITCHEPHGVVTPREMLAKSCNGAIAHWALQTDSASFAAMLDLLGFNSAYDIGLPSRRRSRISPPSSWSARSKATISFGQELSTTALHLAVAATTLANEGCLVTPHLILQRSKGTPEGQSGPLVAKREIVKSAPIYDPAFAPQVLSYLHAATEEGGTAVRCAVDGVEVSAKTGTAQIYNPETKSYRDGSVLASTLALVPTDHPHYIISIAAGNPKGDTQWGANIAAPAVGSIIRGLVSQGKLTSSLTPTF